MHMIAHSSVSIDVGGRSDHFVCLQFGVGWVVRRSDLT